MFYEEFKEFSQLIERNQNILIIISKFHTLSACHEKSTLQNKQKIQMKKYSSKARKSEDTVCYYANLKCFRKRKFSKA